VDYGKWYIQIRISTFNAEIGDYRRTIQMAFEDGGGGFFNLCRDLVDSYGFYIIGQSG